MSRFLDLVSGFSSLQTLFKKKDVSKKILNLKFLDKYARSILPDSKFLHLEKERGVILARVGFAVLKHLKVESNQFAANYAFPINSGTLSY